MALMGAGLSSEERDIILSGVKPWAQLIKWMHDSDEDKRSLELFITKFRSITVANTKDDETMGDTTILQIIQTMIQYPTILTRH